ncbi:hypothetical protein D3C74_495280 [compost metagenome]
MKIIDLFKTGRFDQVKDIIEEEPHRKYDSWDSYMNQTKVIKKDYKAEKRILAERQEK